MNMFEGVGPLGVLKLKSVSRGRINLILGCIVFAFIGYLLVLDYRMIDSSYIGSDATQNLRSALNLVRHGVYGENSVFGDISPGYRREPVPNFLLALNLKLFSLFNPDLLDYSSGIEFSPALLLAAKNINLLYSLGVMLSLWFLSLMLFVPACAAHVISILLAWLASKYFIFDEVNNLNSELPAAFFLLLFSLLILKSVRRPRFIWVLCSGLVLGLLVMTKQVGAYSVFLCIPIVIFLLPSSKKNFFLSLFSISLGFAVLVSPWVVRNRIEFGRFVISKGGGDVLMIRSVFNQMTSMQFRNAFYSYSPIPLRDDVLGQVMGLKDSDHLCGGILEVFSRDSLCDVQALEERRYLDVNSFYLRGKHAEPRALGLEDADRKQEAIERIVSKPFAHLLTSLPLAWRGVWSMRPEKWFDVVLNFFSFAALFFSPLMYALERRKAWIIVSIVPISYFLLYSLLSHFIPRYSEPLIPGSFLCLMMFFVDAVSRIIPPLAVKLRD